MTFVSYAQNCEDVMLWRALRDVEQGFWVDVGAAHPRQDSVTLAFSERGWRGINIEPEPSYAALLREQRPHDVNLQIAVGAAPGRGELQHMSGTGLSTFDPKIAERHVAAGYPSAGPLEVEVRTLADVFEKFAPRHVHFLKIDVEGSEAAVLSGADFTRFRPWIVVVEATEPGSPVRTSSTYEHLLFAADYRECYFDGLNAFYLAAEHAERLQPAFASPPNVFDSFVRIGHLEALNRVAELEAQAKELEAVSASLEGKLGEAERQFDGSRGEIRARDSQAEGLRLAQAKLVQALAQCGINLAAATASGEAARAEAARLEADVARLEEVLARMHESASWRVTAPLRSLARTLRGS